jgi:hypothetical protein
MKMATVDDIVTLIVSFIAVLYMIASVIQALFPKKRQQKQQSRQDRQVGQQNRQEEKEMTLEQYLESLEEEEEKPAKKAALPPPPAPVVSREPPKRAPALAPVEKYEFHSRLDDYQQKTAIDEQKLTIHLRSPDELVSDSMRMMTSEGAVAKKAGKAPIQKLIQSLPKEQLLFISYEVFHVPVCRRETPFPWNG